MSKAQVKSVTLGPIGDKKEAERLAVQYEKDGYQVKVIPRPGRDGEYLVECNLPD